MDKANNEIWFRQWECEAFGYGYGNGENYIIPALHQFLSAVPPKEFGPYDYNELEVACGGTVAWLLINALCAVDAIEYGSSPRFGQLTDEGQALRDYVLGKTVEELLEIWDDPANDDFYKYEYAGNPFMRAAP
jgi:hypothetical protein